MQASVFTAAERTTAADREDDRRSVQRRLDAPLRLITQVALGKLRLITQIALGKLRLITQIALGKLRLITQIALGTYLYLMVDSQWPT